MLTSRLMSICSPIVFGLRVHCVGMWIIACLVGLVIGCIVTFAGRSVLAALLLVPYVTWLSIASALTHEARANHLQFSHDHYYSLD